MNLADTQIIFLCVISVRNGSVCKEMPEKWGRAEENKKKRATEGEEKAGEDEHSEFPQSCNLDTIKMQYFFFQKTLNNTGRIIPGQSLFGLHISTTQPLAFTSLSAYPKLYLIAPISVEIVNPCC